MQSSSDEPPSPQSNLIDTDEFMFAGEGLSVLLIHGLTGTPYEMRYLGERIASTGARVRGVKLAGHAGEPQELGASGPDNWYESVVNGFEDLRRCGDPNIVVGLSMGAVLATRLAADQRSAVSGLVLLAPAFYLTPAATAALRAVKMLGAYAHSLYLHNTSGSDIHDDAARSAHPTCRLMPIGAPLKLLELSAQVRPMMQRVTQPALIIHARNDHTCPMRKNVSFAMKKLGSEHKRAIELEHSYHVVTVDSEKERVADEVIGFAGSFRADNRRAAAG
jgi:carboxylesterase